MNKISTVNLNNYKNGYKKEKNFFINELGKSLKEFGFIIIEGHNIEENIVTEGYYVIKRFFNLPKEVKLKYYSTELLGKRGFTPFGIERAKNNSKSDLKEFWHVGRENFNDKQNEYCNLKNIWPEKEEPLFKSALLNLYHALDQLAYELLSALSEYLGIPNFELAKIAKDGNSILRALHYPPISDGQFVSGSVRAAAHEDINLITILCEATEEGLEILTRDGSWLKIQSQKGQMIMDSGDMLSLLTNNIIPATTHRVINSSNAKNISRYSMPFFVHPKDNYKLKVFESCISPTMPPKFSPIFSDTFLLQRLNENGLIKS